MTEALFERADAAVRGWLFRRTKTDQAFALAEALDDARRWEVAYEKETAALADALRWNTTLSTEITEWARSHKELKRSVEDLTAARDGWRNVADRHMNSRIGLQDEERQRWAARLDAATRQRDRHALVAGVCAGLFVTAVAALAILLLGPFGLH